ncbi:hypothetical protein RUND412_003302 [Rhizina undulata]
MRSLTFLATTLTFLLLNFLLPVLAAPLAGPGDAEVLQKRQQLQLTPNYIVLLNQSAPDTSYGNRYTADIKWDGVGTNDELTTIVGFDVPTNTATTCYFLFYLPASGGFPYSVTGSGVFNYYGLTRNVLTTDTWNTRPGRLASPFGLIFAPQPDGSTRGTANVPCRSNTRFDVELVTYRPSGASSVHWFQLLSPQEGIFLVLDP